MSATFRTVPGGVYFGFTKQELETELTRYKEAVKESGNDLTSSTVNGQQFAWGPRRDMSLQEWGGELQRALALVDPDNYYAAPDRTCAAAR